MILEYGINYVYHSAPLQYSHASEGIVEVSALDGSIVTNKDPYRDYPTILLVTDSALDIPDYSDPVYITSTYIDNVRYSVFKLDSYNP